MTRGFVKSLGYGWPFNEAIIPTMEEENRKLRDENKRLRTRLNTMLTKNITVLPVIKAVECPMVNKLVYLSKCKDCDYFKNRIILTTLDGQGLENVYCAYRDRWDLLEPTKWKSEVQGELLRGKEAE